ncbi:MAG: YicC/YloC family endoribonuclease [Caldibacillus sp.]
MMSMTGFGQGKRETADFTVTVDLRTVNHRFLDFHIRMPHMYLPLETKIKKIIQEHISRGRIDCYVTIQILNPQNRKLQIDWNLLDEYYHFLKEVRARYGFIEEVTLADLLQKDDLVEIVELEAENDTIAQAILRATEDAVINLVDMRKTEGDHLKNDLIAFLHTFKKHVEEIKELAPNAGKEYEEKLAKRMEEYTSGVIDEVRLMTEVAIYAERADIREEITRLESHLEQFHALLDAKQPVGRKMDFLIQEMNREVNTIGAKTGDVAISRNVVDMKSVLEKMREQVQNIE